MSRVLPILFNTEMVRAVMDGRKTVTRRLIKNPPHPDMPDNHTYCRMPLFIKDEVRTLHYMDVIEQYPFRKTRYFKSLAPYDKGDILYVRETWQCWRAHRYEATADIRFKAGGDGVQMQFRNGNTDSVCREDYDEFVGKWYSYHGEWCPSIHMPKEAARIWLKVTDVRAERLQDITEEQAVAEGAVKCYSVIDPLGRKTTIYAEDGGGYYTAGFQSIWDSTVKDKAKYGWDANPWVWAIEFEQCEKPNPCILKGGELARGGIGK